MPPLINYFYNSDTLGIPAALYRGVVNNFAAHLLVDASYGAMLMETVRGAPFHTKSLILSVNRVNEVSRPVDWDTFSFDPLGPRVDAQEWQTSIRVITRHLTLSRLRNSSNVSSGQAESIFRQLGQVELGYSRGFVSLSECDVHPTGDVLWRELPPDREDGFEARVPGGVTLEAIPERGPSQEGVVWSLRNVRFSGAFTELRAGWEGGGTSLEDLIRTTFLLRHSRFALAVTVNRASGFPVILSAPARIAQSAEDLRHAFERVRVL